jgi:hypothetical protein
VLVDIGPVEMAGPGPVLVDIGPVEMAGPGPVLVDIGPVGRQRDQLTTATDRSVVAQGPSFPRVQLN